LGTGQSTDRRGCIDGWNRRRYVTRMSNQNATPPEPGSFRDFMSSKEAPVRVTLVIVVTVIGVLLVAWDTSRRAKPTTTVSPAAVVPHGSP
jgi:hypothetical protein